MREALKVSFVRLPEGKAEGEEERTYVMEYIRCDAPNETWLKLWSLESDEETPGFFRPRIWLEDMLRPRADSIL